MIVWTILLTFILSMSEEAMSLTIGEYGAQIQEQTDGKIVVATSFNSNSVITRLNNDGSEDLQFGNQGRTILQLTKPMRTSALTVHQNGKIIVAGWVEGSSGLQYHYFIAVLNLDGSLDSEFGNNGIIEENFGSDLNASFITNLIIQNDGFLALGSVGSIDSSNRDFLAMHYTFKGDLDVNYGSNGIARIDINQMENEVFNSAIQADGKVILAGRVLTDLTGWGTTRFAMARLTVDGKLDTSFGGGAGYVITEIDAVLDSWERITAIQILSNEKIVVMGDANYETVLAKYFPDGSLDLSFNGTGIVRTIFGNAIADSGAMTINNDNHILIGGAHDGTSSVASFKDDGSTEEQFGLNGLAQIDFFKLERSKVIDITKSSDNKLLLLARGRGPTPFSLLGIVKLLPNGNLDTSFQGIGMVKVNEK